MSQHAMPFFDSAEEATKEAIRKSGKPMKDVAKALWPEKSIEAGATALRNALNENRDERLTADQHLFIANYLSEFDWLYYAAHRCGHSQPVPIEPEDQHARLQREFCEAVAKLGHLQKEIQISQVRLRAA